jgi:hypothetical protein
MGVQSRTTAAEAAQIWAFCVELAGGLGALGLVFCGAAGLLSLLVEVPLDVGPEAVEPYRRGPEQVE